MSEIDIGFKDLEHTHPTLFKFANDPARVKVVIGPAGSAKTSYVATDLLKIACMQHPDREGVRHSRFLIIRNIYKDLSTATKETMRVMMSPLVHFTNSDPPEGKAFFALGDGTKVSIKMDFLAMDSPNAYNTLLGYEPTAVYFDEINKVSEEAVLAAARRVGRYPGKLLTQGNGVVGHCVLGSCNGPIKNSWLHKWSQGERKDIFSQIEAQTNTPFFALYRQPPALLRPTTASGKWEPNPEAENISNLVGGYNYYYEMLAGEDQDIQAFVEGDWANLPLGTRVFPTFSKMHIIAHDKIKGLAKSGLFLSFDYGRTPVGLIAVQNVSGGLIIVGETMGEQMGMSTFYSSKLYPYLMKNFPAAAIAAAWGDPAGFSKDNSGEASPVSVLMENGIEVQHPGTNNIEPRLEAVRRHMMTLNGANQPMLMVSDRCEFLIEALSSTYVYAESKLQAGEIKDLPTKSHVRWVSDLADALQYMALGYFTQFRPTSELSGIDPYLTSKHTIWV